MIVDEGTTRVNYYAQKSRANNLLIVLLSTCLFCGTRLLLIHVTALEDFMKSTLTKKQTDEVVWLHQSSNVFIVLKHHSCLVGFY